MSNSEIIESNIGEVLEDEQEFIDDALDNVTPSMNFNIRNDIDFLNTVQDEKPKYINIPWQTYRVGSFIIVLISIFVLQIFHNLLEKKYPDPYILLVYKIVAFFLLLNLISFLFIFTFYKYRQNVKGPKGEKGKRGKKGYQGVNAYCDVSKKKVKHFIKNTKRDNAKKKKMIVDEERKNNTVFDPTVSNPKRAWLIDDNNPRQQSGIKCIPNENCEYKNVSYNNDINIKPLIGVSINSDINGKINELQYNIDNNKFFDKNKYKVGLHGNNTNKYTYYKSIDKSSEHSDKNKNGKFGKKTNNKNLNKNNFICKPNSALYKIDTIYDNQGIKGLKYYCQDLDNGKVTKSLNNDGKEVYGVVFGNEPKIDSKDYFFKSLSCDPKINDDNTVLPSFIGDVSAEYNKDNIKSIAIENCIYKE